jgi:hypothetical protein
MSNSPSRSRGAHLRPGFASLLHSPQSRGGRSAERRSGACEAPVGHAMTRRVRRLARRHASHDAGRSPLGAPPWRFWAPGAALLSPNTRLRRSFGRHPDRSQRAPRSQVVVPGGRGPCLPRRRLQAAAAGRHTSLRLQDVPGRRPSKSEAANLLLQPHFVVNRRMRIVAKKIWAAAPSARRNAGSSAPEFASLNPAAV